MKHPANTSSGIFQRCPHLGLQDDRSTSLAYPSTWNYCYRADPAHSVLLSYQEAVCLTAAHQQCPVLLRAASGPLPVDLRGVHEVPGERGNRKGGMFLLLVLVLIVGAAVLIAPRYYSGLFPSPVVSPTDLPPISTLSPTGTSTNPVSNNLAQGIIASFTADAKTRIAKFTSTPEFTGTPPTATRTSTPTRTFTPTKTPSRTRTPTITLSPLPTASFTVVPPPATGIVCGHPLDTPFGGTSKFLLHRILPGENLTIYADTFGTTTTAILAVNYRLPLPVWADWVVVIPFQSQNVEGIPPFEPYQAVDARISLEELARQLNADPALLRSYNDFKEPCGSFSGWLLVPRPTP